MRGPATGGLNQWKGKLLHVRKYFIIVGATKLGHTATQNFPRFSSINIRSLHYPVQARQCIRQIVGLHDPAKTRQVDVVESKTLRNAAHAHPLLCLTLRMILFSGLVCIQRTPFTLFRVGIHCRPTAELRSDSRSGRYVVIGGIWP